MIHSYAPDSDEMFWFLCLQSGAKPHPQPDKAAAACPGGPPPSGRLLPAATPAPAAATAAAGADPAAGAGVLGQRCGESFVAYSKGAVLLILPVFQGMHSWWFAAQQSSPRVSCAAHAAGKMNIDEPPVKRASKSFRTGSYCPLHAAGAAADAVAWAWAARHPAPQHRQREQPPRRAAFCRQLPPLRITGCARLAMQRAIVAITGQGGAMHATLSLCIGGVSACGMCSV